MQGAEYLSPEVLSAVWFDLDDWVRGEIRRLASGLSGFLARHAPRFRQVGHVCFHLAENKQDSDRPFAFLATYATGLNRQGRVRYSPLSRALEELGKPSDRKRLARLLTPISLAAEQCPLLAELVETGDLFHPLAWTPEEAYRFLREAHAFEEAGVLLRLPDWWKQRPRPRVGITLGDSRPSRLGLDALLDLRLHAALGEDELTKEELEGLLESEGGLILFKGQWVEVDREKLTQALEHWKAVVEETREGEVSLFEGMRLLAGAPSDLGPRDEGWEKLREWSFVRAGGWLASTLAELRSPGSPAAVSLGRALRTRLRPYQQEGLNWLRFLCRLRLGGCLADDMGLGKTVQVIALLLVLKKEEAKSHDHGAPPALLVVPASLLANWKAECRRFAPSLNVRVLHPSETPREKLAALEEKPGKDIERDLDGCHAVLTTYGMLTRNPWMLRHLWGLAVLDEAQAIKNPGSKQSRAVKKIRAPWRLALTGTPVENRLTDLWSLFDFINPGLLGSGQRFRKFAKALETRDHDRYAPLRTLVRPYILRRLKTDRSVIDDLPEKVEVTAYCGLTRGQAKQYIQLTTQLRQSLDQASGMKRRGLVLSHLLRLKQLCNHPDQLQGLQEYVPEKSSKFLRLGELCAEIASRGEKALVFTQFREPMDGLAAFLDGIFERPGLVLHGGTSLRRRRTLVNAFQEEGGPPYFLLSLKAGGTGLNLTAASHVFLFDRWWNPAVEAQAVDRAFRIGQKKNILVHKFVCRGTVEEKIQDLLSEKAHMAEEILDSGPEHRLTEMSDDDIMDLVTLDVDRAQMREQ